MDSCVCFKIALHQVPEEASSSHSRGDGVDPPLALKDLRIPKLGPMATAVDLANRKALSKSLKKYKDQAVNPRLSTSARLDSIENAHKTHALGMQLIDVSGPIAATLSERAHLIGDNRQVVENMKLRAEQELRDAVRLGGNCDAQESLERRLAQKLGQNESHLQLRGKTSLKKNPAPD
jgi:hypothetical protein